MNASRGGRGKHVGAGPKDLQKGMRAQWECRKMTLSIFTQKNSFLFFCIFLWESRFQISSVIIGYSTIFGLESEVTIFIVQLPDSVDQNLEVGLRIFYHSDNSFYGKILCSLRLSPLSFHLLLSKPQHLSVPWQVSLRAFAQTPMLSGPSHSLFLCYPINIQPAPTHPFNVSINISSLGKPVLVSSIPLTLTD